MKKVTSRKIVEKVIRNESVRRAAIAFLALSSIAFANTALGQPSARMGISPDRYHIEFDERGGEMQSLVIQNLSDEPLHLRFSVSNWTLDDNNQIVGAPPTESSLDQWIVINPMNITVPPGTPQTVRWAVMPRLKPIDGEYRAIIFVEEDLPAKETQDGTAVQMKMRYGMPIYAQVGEVVENGALHEVRADVTGQQVFLELDNNGNKHARVSGNYGVWPAADFPGSEEALKQLRNFDADAEPESGLIIANLPGSVVLPGERRAAPVSIPVAETGDYVIQFNASFANIEITESLQFKRRDPEEAEEIRTAQIPGDLRLISSAD